MSRESRFLATEFVACLKPQAEIIIVKRHIQGRNNVTRGWVNPDNASRVVANKKALALLASLLGDSQEDSLSLLNIRN